MDIIYKILFEVRLLHEFYGTNSDGATIFQQPFNNRTGFLLDRFSRNERSIASDIYVKVPQTAEQLYHDYHLRLLPTYSGFKVAIRVKRVNIAGPLVAFEPVVPLPADLSIPVLIMRRGMDLDAVTNTRMQRNLNSVFYFSGDTMLDTKTHPFLTEDAAPFAPGYSYEQGEIATHGPGDLRSFYFDEFDAPQWRNLAPGSYAGEKDRFVVKPDFTYTFQPGDNVTSATFTLKDHTNAVVVDPLDALANPYNVAGNGNLASVPLSFNVMNLNTIPQMPISNKLLYTLQVTGNGGYNRTFKIVFLRDLQTDIRDTWGLAYINNKPANALFHLTDASKRLIYKLNPNGTVNTPAPLFEVWINSRFPFWRYINDQKKKLKALPHAGILYESGDNLISLQPQPLSYTPLLIGGVNYRPNPKLFGTLKTEGRKVFADIMVPESELFPLGP